jgi:hypothetical protein
MCIGSLSTKTWAVSPTTLMRPLRKGRTWVSSGIVTASSSSTSGGIRITCLMGARAGLLRSDGPKSLPRLASFGRKGRPLARVRGPATAQSDHAS